MRPIAPFCALLRPIAFSMYRFQFSFTTVQYRLSIISVGVLDLAFFYERHFLFKELGVC